MTRFLALVCLTFAIGCSPATVTAASAGAIELRPVGQFNSGISDDGATEIAAYDPATARLFVVNASQRTVDILDLSKPWEPVRAATLDVTPYGASANSVAVRDGVVAVAVEADPKQAPGHVVFFATSGQFLGSVQVGALPDMLTFTPDGTKVLVANEGEPKDYCSAGLDQDPEGSVSIIDVSAGVAGLTQASVTTAGFGAFNGGVPAGVRIFGPHATVAQDLEPEYIAISDDSATAWVTLQENNALAVLDIATATVTQLLPLGTKDHSRSENALDASDKDGTARIVPWPVHGMFQPDGIASYQVAGKTFLVTANEGDARDYDCYSEEERVEDLTLDPVAFPDAAKLQEKEQLGRLKTTSAGGDEDGDGQWETIYSYGARSFSIWSGSGELVFDSGRDFELITAGLQPASFNSSGEGSFDSRSDDKGPEPEGVALGRFRGRTYAFIGLERTGGVMVYDVTEPGQPFFVQYASNRQADGSPAVGVADQAPEGVLFISKADSPIDRALLVLANEVSGTVTVYSVLPRTE